jgi:hypothetical protein
MNAERIISTELSEQEHVEQNQQRSRIPRANLAVCDRILSQNVTGESSNSLSSSDSVSTHFLSTRDTPSFIPSRNILQQRQTSFHSESSEEKNTNESDEELSSQSSIGPPPCNNQTELRKQILQIQADTTIPASEKAKRIQELMTRPWQQKQKIEQKKDPRVQNFLSNKTDDFSIVLDSDKVQTYHVLFYFYVGTKCLGL